MNALVTSIALFGHTKAQRSSDQFVEELSSVGTDRNERRISQLATMMRIVNPEFEERKHWTYGCNCLMLGDRPLSEPGRGPPVDALDTTCKAYKDCLTCASKTYGHKCVAEATKYRFGKNKELKCKNNPDTCERSICECDKQFAQAHAAAFSSFNSEYQLFYSNWDPENDCKRPGNGFAAGLPSGFTKLLTEGSLQCCGTIDGPASLINSHTRECCRDGTSAELGGCLDRNFLIRPAPGPFDRGLNSLE